MIAGAPSLDQIPEKCRSHVTCMRFFVFMLRKVEVDADGLQKRDAASAEKYKIEYSNASSAAGLIQISMHRKPKNIRRNAQLFRVFKIGSHRNSKL